MSLTGGRNWFLLSTGLLHLVLIPFPTLTQAQDNVLKAHQDMRPALVRIEGIGETTDGEPISVLGTGVLLDANGTILTALHVLAPLEASDPSKIDIHVRIREVVAAPREAERIDSIQARDLAILRISDPPEDLSYACRTTSGDPPDNLPILLTSGFESDGLYVRRQGPIIGSGPRGSIFVDMAVVEAQSGSPVYKDSGEVVGILKGVREGQTGESVFIPLSDVLGRLPPLPDDCPRQVPSGAEPEAANSDDTPHFIDDRFLDFGSVVPGVTTMDEYEKEISNLETGAYEELDEADVSLAGEFFSHVRVVRPRSAPVNLRLRTFFDDSKVIAIRPSYACSEGDSCRQTCSSAEEYFRTWVRKNLDVLMMNDGTERWSTDTTANWAWWEHGMTTTRAETPEFFIKTEWREKEYCTHTFSLECKPRGCSSALYIVATPR